MALPHYRKKKKITTNIDDRAHFRHNEIKLKELRAIKLPSGTVATPTIGFGWDKKKKEKSLLGPFLMRCQKMCRGITNETGTEGIILNHSLFF